MTNHQDPKRQLEFLSTGDPALDHILGGGIPARSFNIIAGAPGTGKTLFTLQMIFSLARQGKKVLYFTTLAEPAIKLIRYMQIFPFFDERLVDKNVLFIDLGSVNRVDDADAVLTSIVDRVEKEEPFLVAIDSFKALVDLRETRMEGRRFAYDLAVQLAGWGATTLIVGEYTVAEILTRPEFAIADAILRLSNEAAELTTLRVLEVLKLRGAGYVSGQHFFDIGGNGLTFFPRVRAPSPAEEPAITPSDRVSTGVAGLDDMLHGGLPRTSATLVQGGTGTGKTLFGLQFLMDGVRRGEKGILFTLEENREQLYGIARNYGWDLAAEEKKGLFRLVYTPPVELSTDRFLNEARSQAEALGASRAVLDSLTSLSLSITSERRFKELVYALTKHFRYRGTTVLMTMEIPELLGSARITGHGVSFAADNLIQLRYVESKGSLVRALAVLKARGTRHATEAHHLAIGEDGLALGAAFKDWRGVLTGEAYEERLT